jgi:transcriptional regulator with XRE-family HTH domain
MSSRHVCNDWRSQLGQQVRRLREAAGETLADTARQAGTTPQWLERFEAGDEDMSVTELWALARSLGMVLEIGFRPVTVIHSPDEIPANMTECEEHVFWETHDMGDEFFENVEPDPEDEAVIERIRASRAQRQTRPA